MRTTLDLPDPLFRELKARAAMKGMKLKDLLTAYVEAGLRGALTAKPASRPRSPIPVARRAKRPITSLTNAQLQSIFDEEDATKR